MSCKYCEGREPLGVEDGTRLRIVRDKHDVARLTVDGIDGIKLVKAIDFCPVCGDELRPFGPAWAHAE